VIIARLKHYIYIYAILRTYGNDNLPNGGTLRNKRTVSTRRLDMFTPYVYVGVERLGWVPSTSA